MKNYAEPDWSEVDRHLEELELEEKRKTRNRLLSQWKKRKKMRIQSTSKRGFAR